MTDPSVVGPYRVVRRVAAGGQASVFECENASGDGQDPRRFALKLLNKPSSERRFERELLLTRLVAHRNVVQIRDSGYYYDRPYLVMDLLSGSLDDTLQESGPLEPADAGAIAFQIISGMHAIHSYGIVHRDLKPQNILINKDGTARVSDFGVAVAGDTPGMTLDGMPVGSPHYMAPEQATGQGVDYRADIFSFGCVLHFMLTGKAPLGELGVDDVLDLYRARRKPELSDPRLNQVPEVSDLIARCLEPRPSDRFQTFEELKEALGAIWPGLAEQHDDAPENATLTQTSEVAGGRDDLVSKLEAEVIAFDHARRTLHQGLDPQDIGRVMLRIADSVHDDGRWKVGVAFTPELDFEGKDGTLEVTVSATGEVTAAHRERSPRPASTLAKLTRTRMGVLGFFAVPAAILVALLIPVLSTGGSDSLKFKLDVSSPWQPTGIRVTTGDRVVIRASGLATYTGCCEVTADGFSMAQGLQGVARPNDDPSEWVARRLPFASLVGRFGEEGRPVYIGQYMELEAPVDGELFLSINDTFDAFHDNTRGWDIELSVDELPATITETAAPSVAMRPNATLDGLIVSWTDDLDFETGFVLYDPDSDATVARFDADVTETTLPLPAPGETDCLFVRPTSEDGYRMASVTSCFTNMLASETLAVSDIIEPPLKPWRIALSPDESRMVIADFTSITILDTETFDQLVSARMPIDSSRGVNFVGYDETDERIFVTASGSGGGVFFALDAETARILGSLEAPGLNLNSAYSTPGNPHRAVAAGHAGWLIIDLESVEIEDRVDLGNERLVDAILSPDGSTIYGQYASSTTDDAVYAFDLETGKQIGEFIYGDKGGATVYYASPEGDRIVQLVGDSARSQNAYILSPGDLSLVQELGVPGFSHGTVSLDGGSLLVVQNRDFYTFSQNGGSTVHRLTPISLDEWTVTETVSLVVGSTITEGQIVASESRSRYYVANRQVDRIFVIDETH